ncbi:hypothetical protein AVEN_26562-1 [Araneus ventricosus]|uniref:Uncharacterized protein n=1 Tax=Araneus ventricosus TaxID=182803 RepID=A0A4Y2FTB0_ARAVE|nr:hypothetical protein AVEN_26562-1 [Araneus ventricosus]
MTRTTSEMAPSLQTSTPHQWEIIFFPDGFNVHQTRLHGCSSVESGFESGTLRPRDRDLTTGPPRPDHPACDTLSYSYYTVNKIESEFIITSRFEATRGLFWVGHRNLEPRSDDEDDTSAGAPSPKFHATLTGGRLATTHDLACNGPHTRRIFCGRGFRAWSSPVPEPGPYH